MGASSSPAMPRIAIVGNMNNGGFAIMRYFRDLGADAHLLPYSTDGQGNLAHFAPEADTWYPERSQPFIHALGVPNASATLLSTSGILWSVSERRRLDTLLAGYDLFVASGIAPALFAALGRRLDIYFPYGMGIEFYGDIEFRNRMRSSWVRRLAHGGLRLMQARGIRATRHCLNAEMSLTQDSFNAIGKPFLRLAIPAVYNAEDPPARVPPTIEAAIGQLRAADLSLFSCARLLWVRDPHLGEREWRSFTKNSDWMFHGLARFVAQHPGVRVLLAVVEYGPDVEASKQLVASLRLQDHVLWLPKMPRREIMLLLTAVDIGIGEFYQDHGVIWGGTGWEILASGRPFVQSFNFTPQGFAAEFGHPPPPVLDVKGPDDLARHLADGYRDPERRRQVGREGLAWFNAHNGVGLARRWLDLLSAPPQPGV